MSQRILPTCYRSAIAQQWFASLSRLVLQQHLLNTFRNRLLTNWDQVVVPLMRMAFQDMVFCGVRPQNTTQTGGEKKTRCLRRGTAYVLLGDFAQVLALCVGYDCKASTRPGDRDMFAVA